MDSRNIFISSQRYLRNITWEINSPDSEWRFIGEDHEKAKLVLEGIFSYEESLYLATNRHNSIEKAKQDILNRINELLERQDFSVWDIRFEKVIEFSRVGVYRVGTRNM